MNTSVRGEIEFFDGVFWGLRELEEYTPFEELKEAEDGYTYGLVEGVPIRFVSSPRTFVSLFISEEVAFV